MKELYEIDDLLAQNPVRRVMENRYAMKFIKVGVEAVTSCPFHPDGKRPNLRVSEAKNLWHCDVCNIGGNIINFIMRKESIDFKRACETLGAKTQPHRPAEEDKTDWTSRVPVATYDYCDARGTLIYQVCRYQTPDPDHPSGYNKTFRQRRPDSKGGWLWNMENVIRVPYRLPDLLKNQHTIVNIVEGEKDAETLIKLGLTATTNVGGAEKWLAAYSDFLTGRECAIWPDNDDKGKKHADDVFTKLAPKAKSIRILKVPEPHKDVTDWVKSFSANTLAIQAIGSQIDAATPLYGGIEIPIRSMSELEEDYRRQTQESAISVLNLSNWLPGLQREVRSILPGEVAVFLAATGVGKTCLLQNLAIHAAPLVTLMFELELPGELTFERFVASGTNTSCPTVFDAYAQGGSVDWRSGGNLNHIHVCSRSPMGCEEIEKIIDKSELKIGARPLLVLVDYIQLVMGQGKTRYERTSEIAERIKSVAKRTGTIIFIASQISRPGEDESPVVSIYDGKDSGSIENSAGLVIGAWREPDRAEILKLKILKNTKGRPGKIVTCNFNGETMRITERGPELRQSDLPEYRTSNPDPG